MGRLIFIIFVMFSMVAFGKDSGSLSLSATSDDVKTFIQELNDRKAALDDREFAIEQREKALDDYQKNLNKQSSDLVSMQKSIEDKLQQINSINDNNTKQLAQIYSGTDPKSASASLQKMPVDNAAKIMRTLTPINAGKIMTEIGKSNPDFAAKLSDRIAPSSNGLGNL